MIDPSSRFVTNADRNVFALHGLPEEVVAVLFAYYSRSRDDLRTNLRKLLDDRDLAILEGAETSFAPALSTAQEKARTFHERWVVGYGHASVAEHGVVHLGIEGCSIVAAKALEEARLGAYTEKSTRYVRFGEDTLVTDIGLPRALETEYVASARACLRAYAESLPRVEAALAERHPLPEGTSPKAHENALRAHALDLLRGLLPAGVPTNLGLTMNGRVLEQHLSRLLGSPLDEIRRIATAMRDEARVILPTLLKYTEPRPFRSDAARRLAPFVPARRGAEPAKRVHRVRTLGAPDAAEALRTIAAAALADTMHLPWDEANAIVGEPARARDVFDAYMRDRGRHDAPLRALEQVVLRFEIECDYGAWRDLQRHRLLSATTPLLCGENGYWFADELDELGLGDAVARAAACAYAPWARIAREYRWHAQYSLPLAYRVRYVAQANLREVYHLVELRSGRQGHESYRQVAIGLADRAIEAFPFIEETLRVDRAQYAYARH